MFGNFSSKPKLKKNIYDELISGNPIKPEYGVTSSLTPNNERCWGADDRDFAFYEKFDVFDQIINELYEDDAFRLQEQKETLCRMLGVDSPTYGRCYSIFYNKIKIGSLEIKDYSYFASNEVQFHIEVFGDLAQYLPYENIFGFLNSLGILLISSDDINRIKFSMEITRAMSASVWQRDNDGNLDPSDIELSYHGIPSHYLKLRENPYYMKLRENQKP